MFYCARRDPGLTQLAGFPPVAIPWVADSPPPADWTLFTVKAQDSASAAAMWLSGLTGGVRPTAVIQNGVHQAARVAPFPAIPVLAYVYIEQQDGWHKPYPPPRENFSLPAGQEALARLLESAGFTVKREADFHTAAWRKLLLNCVSHPVTALSGRGLEALRAPQYRELAEAILAEGIVVARADGARLDPDESERILAALAAYPPGTRTSMLQDRERGRTVEIDALNGAVVELGRALGLGVEINRQTVARVHALSGT